MNLTITSKGLAPTEEQNNLVRRRIDYALGRWAERIGSIVVQLSDLNGPRGGIDKRCSIELRFKGEGLFFVEVRDLELEPAICRAAERMAGRLRRGVSRRRDEARRGPSVMRRRICL